MIHHMAQQTGSMREKAQQIFSMVKGFAKEANEVEVTFTHNIGEYLRFGNNELGQSQFTKSMNLSVRVAIGKKQARATTGRMENSDIDNTVHKPLAQAKGSLEDPATPPLLRPQNNPPVNHTHYNT